VQVPATAPDSDSQNRRARKGRRRALREDHVRAAAIWRGTRALADDDTLIGADDDPIPLAPATATAPAPVSAGGSGGPEPLATVAGADDEPDLADVDDYARTKVTQRPSVLRHRCLSHLRLCAFVLPLLFDVRGAHGVARVWRCTSPRRQASSPGNDKNGPFLATLPPLTLAPFRPHASHHTVLPVSTISSLSAGAGASS